MGVVDVASPGAPDHPTAGFAYRHEQSGVERPAQLSHSRFLDTNYSITIHYEHRRVEVGVCRVVSDIHRRLAKGNPHRGNDG